MSKPDKKLPSGRLAGSYQLLRLVSAPWGEHMSRVRDLILVLATAGALLTAGCGGGRSSSVPQTPGSSPTPAGMGSTTTLSADQINAALSGVQSSFEALPHVDLTADLQALATQMVSSGTFAGASVGPGGITATFRDGTTAFVFADRLMNSAGKYAPTSLRREIQSSKRPSFLPLSPANSHDVVFLVDGQDPEFFRPEVQAAEASAFKNLGFGTAAGGVDDLDVSLENIIALGKDHSVDFLDINTIGGVVGRKPDLFYLFQSMTPVNGPNLAAYQEDLRAGNLYTSVTLYRPGGPGNGNTKGQTRIAFAPQFLTKYIHFTPGAIVINGASFGQNPEIASGLHASLRNAGVGRYYGWTKIAEGTDREQTNAFLYDRLLGEQAPSVTGLSALAAQQIPPQRPFPLDDIGAVMQTEIRRGTSAFNFRTSVYTYAVSDVGYEPNSHYLPLEDGTAAKFVISDFGGGSVADPLVEYALPSIVSMSVVEPAATNPATTYATLTIKGRFPITQGTVSLTDSAGVYALKTMSWTPTSITAQLPYGGAGTAGLVQVATAGGVQSNNVPLTQWKGTLVYKESDTIPDFGNLTGSGSGNLTVTYNITFRADVHRVVQTIDTAPVPQNFAFSSVQADSKAVLWPFTGSFTSSEGSKPTYTFSLQGNAPETMDTALPPIGPTEFEFRAFSEGVQPAPCNNGLPGVQGRPGNIFCPISTWYAQNPIYGGGAVYTNDFETGSYGVPSRDAGGLIMMTMDPATYSVSMPDSTTTYKSSHFGGRTADTARFNRPAVATMTGSFQAAYTPGASTTTASTRRTATSLGRDAHR